MAHDVGDRQPAAGHPRNQRWAAAAVSLSAVDRDTFCTCFSELIHPFVKHVCQQKTRGTRRGSSDMVVHRVSLCLSVVTAVQEGSLKQFHPCAIHAGADCSPKGRWWGAIGAAGEGCLRPVSPASPLGVSRGLASPPLPGSYGHGAPHTVDAQPPQPPIVPIHGTPLRPALAQGERGGDLLPAAPPSADVCSSSGNRHHHRPHLKGNSRCKAPDQPRAAAGSIALSPPSCAAAASIYIQGAVGCERRKHGRRVDGRANPTQRLDRL